MPTPYPRAGAGAGWGRHAWTVSGAPRSTHVSASAHLSTSRLCTASRAGHAHPSSAARIADAFATRGRWQRTHAVACARRVSSRASYVLIGDARNPLPSAADRRSLPCAARFFLAERRPGAEGVRTLSAAQSVRRRPGGLLMLCSTLLHHRLQLPPPTAHYADLILLGASAPAAHAASAGLRKSITPVSTHGPACSGAMRALVCRQSSLVNTLIQGRSAMFQYPLAPAARMPPPRRARASKAPSGGAAQPQRAARRRRRGDSTETESSAQSVSDATSDLEDSIASDDSPPWPTQQQWCCRAPPTPPSAPAAVPSVCWAGRRRAR